jgi:DNA adenine methylase
MGNIYAAAFTDPKGAAPFLKWAGGKQWLAAALAPLVPKGARYYEPFLGGASLFFAALPRQAYLSDVNQDLVQTYEALRDSPETILRHLRGWRYTKKMYYATRRATFRGSAKQAARFIFLNRTCWNGLYRVNAEGQFNVPIGRFKRPRLFDRRILLGASAALKGAHLLASDFEKALEGARARDFVYLDPPYTVKHDNNGFLRYNQRLFTWNDQERLGRVAVRLAARGCRVVVTNAHHPSIRSLYPDFHATTLRRQSMLAGDAAERGTVREVLLSSFPISPSPPVTPRGDA